MKCNCYKKNARTAVSKARIASTVPKEIASILGNAFDCEYDDDNFQYLENAVLAMNRSVFATNVVDDFAELYADECNRIHSKERYVAKVYKYLQELIQERLDDADNSLLEAKGKHIKESRYMSFIDYSWSRKLDSVAVIEFKDFCEKNAGVNTDVETMEVREWDKLLHAWGINIGEKLKEGEVKRMRGNGGWPYDEDDIVWGNDDEVLVSLMPNAYPEDIQDAIMGSGAFDALPKEVEDEIEAIERNFQEACKAYGGYEFVFDGDGESGMIEPKETGFICMKYGDFILMCDEYGFDPNTIDVSMKSEWY